MRKIRKIIVPAIYLNLLLSVSIGIAGVSKEKPARPYELVSKSLKKESVPDSNQSITVSELLKRYVETQEKLKKSYIYKGEDKSETETTRSDRPKLIQGVKYERFEKIELRTDSKNYYSSHKRWGDSPELGRRIKEDQVAETRSLWNGESDFQYNDNPESAKALLWLTPKENVNINQIHYILDGQAGGPIRGFFIGSAELIDAELEHAESISVQEKKETINGSDCFVINAKTNRSEYAIWIDPEHGYNIAQAIVQRNSVTAGDPSEYENPPVGTSQVSLKNVVFKNIDDVWLPVECDYTIYNKSNNGEYTLENHHHKITEFSINPDHEALGSFDPNSFIKNGSRVQFTNNQGVTYLWKDGKIVDSYGYELSLTALTNPSLVGKILPSIAEFGINLEPDVFKNNKLLICFFDYSQRPSRNCVLTLNEKTQSLLDKNIFLIFIQAESISEGTLTSWLKQNEIVPRVGKSKIDLHALELRWGVKSLPWLILTDTNHDVTDEGFSITDLDEKIKK